MPILPCLTCITGKKSHRNNSRRSTRNGMGGDGMQLQVRMIWGLVNHQQWPAAGWDTMPCFATKQPA